MFNLMQNSAARSGSDQTLDSIVDLVKQEVVSQLSASASTLAGSLLPVAAGAPKFPPSRPGAVAGGSWPGQWRLGAGKGGGSGLAPHSSLRSSGPAPMTGAGACSAACAAPRSTAAVSTARPAEPVGTGPRSSSSPFNGRAEVMQAQLHHLHEHHLALNAAYGIWWERVCRLMTELLRVVSEQQGGSV